MNWGAYLLHTCKVGAKSGKARRSHVVCLAGCLACNLVEIINGDCLAGTEAFLEVHRWVCCTTTLVTRAVNCAYVNVEG